MLRKGTATARALARIAGQCISMTKAVIPAKLLLRNLYRCIKQKSTWQDNLVIDKATERDLTWWWSALDHWNGRAFKSQCKEYVQMTTDASLEGWGSNLMIESGYQARGFWDLDMMGKSSNHREIMAVYLSLI
ncbi:transposon tf2-9 polyprotein [Plakobranchus ocellatus]|uniref:Transposon tf2-9 polyprotein n=1 Tax=Plakobranchus ocellatus TaxID=259542 RepID=A0AAV3XZG4_9GAST|nr:transposon tf2-9 polyprotein [Plakobranchus ocellatus]